MKQHKLFGHRAELIVPARVTDSDLTYLLEESKEIVNKAMVDYDPYAVVLMLSGGDDSVTALQVSTMLGIKIDFIIHGVTGTGLRACREYVTKLAHEKAIPLLYADAGNAYEDYVKRKGFFGRGKDAHKYSYHILKDNPFGKTISKHLRKGLKNRRILLLNGVRVEESENRADNFGEEAIRQQSSSPNNYWVNIIHWWTKKQCLQLLDAESIKRSPVAIDLGRSGECNCGTMQTMSDITAAMQYDKEFGSWMQLLRKSATEKFGWDICTQPGRAAMDALKKQTAELSEEMPMCVGCKFRANTLF